MVTWAQRPKLIFLTVCLSDCPKPDIKVEKDRLHFKGVGGTDKKEYEVDIEFFKEIDPEVKDKDFTVYYYMVSLHRDKPHLRKWR